MTWTLHRQQQQCGAQLPNKQAGEAPREATEGRAAQDHEQAGATPPPGEAPASRLADRDQDITPTAAEPRVDWDEVVQPERPDERRRREEERGEDPPLPEGK